MKVREKRKLTWEESESGETHVVSMWAGMCRLEEATTMGVAAIAASHTISPPAHPSPSPTLLLCRMGILGDFPSQAIELSEKSSKTEYTYPQFCISFATVIR
jgi:hypothetical protein